ncbi:MAG: glutathione synthase [Pseudomonadota bacterium]|nr:glutathione synthase [Pseudomonadota bacterium]
MRSLFVMDPIERLNLAGDSTYMLMRESSARGWPVSWCTPTDLHIRGGRTWARAEAVTTLGEAPHFLREIPGDVELGEFDLVWMRKDPPFDMEYIFATYLLERVPETTLVLNRPSAVRSYNEKLHTLDFPDLCVDTLVARDRERIVAFANEHERIVIKPWDGNGGRGVLVTSARDANLRSMIELLTQEGRQAIFAQRYIPEIVQGDKRIILVDGEPVGAMMRVPSGDDHRGNMHAGASVVSSTLDARDREICAAIGPRLREQGLLFAGIDVIGGWLTEINVTSPTGIQEINRLDGVRIEALLLDAAVRAHRRADARHA